MVAKQYGGQEETETTDSFQIGKGVHQGCILSPCLFNLYAEHIMQNARLDEAQAGIKIAEKNINNLRYGNGNPLQYSCLENSMNRGTWVCSLRGRKESDTTHNTHTHYARLCT